MKKINQINANDEGLLAYVKRQEKMIEEMNKISGIPKKLMGDVQKFRPAGQTIMGSAEFIEKFLNGLSNEQKKHLSKPK